MFGIGKKLKQLSPLQGIKHYRKKAAAKKHKKEKLAHKEEQHQIRKGNREFEAELAKEEEGTEARKDEARKKYLAERQPQKELAEKRNEEKAEEFFNREHKGLTTQQKGAMQLEARRNIETDQYHRGQRLSGQQAQRGISHKSGVAFAQDQALRAEGQEAHRRTTRDIEEADQAQRLRNMAGKIVLKTGEDIKEDLEHQRAYDIAETKENQRFNRKNAARALKDYRTLTRF